ncbi:MAG TPA: ABC transporter permease [Acidobacteriaceae bacterium]|jgi:predicted permease|nr:ABC transporter permease [Acidobacteriaceae bacterium]
METLLQDVRYAMRQLRKSPGFALIAVLTLSLGVGAATAIFSVVNAAILRPLPYDQPDRIYAPVTLAKEGYTQPFSWLSFKDVRAQNHVFAAFSGVWNAESVNLETPSGPVALQSVQGSDNFFDVFGVAPILGRTFRPGEDQAGRNDVAVLSYTVWQTNFGGRSDVVGRTIDLDGRPYTCIGVMPEGFRYPLSAQHAIYTPIHPNPVWMNGRGSHWLRTVGRLKPGVTRQQAQADMNAVMGNLGKAYPDTDGGRRLQMMSLTDSVNGQSSGPLVTLSVAVLALLLIGCVNVAGLLLARGVKREREIALRAAVGANRTRLIRQILTESLLLAGMGAAGGIALAALLLQAMRTFLVHALARGTDVQMNWMVLVAALLLSTLTSVAASLFPAVRLSGTDPNQALRSGGSAGTARAHHRLRSVFIVSQMALSLVLLVVAGVLLRSVAGYRSEDLGFDAKHILAAEISLSPGHYANRDLWTNFYQPMLERVNHLPGVAAAGLNNLVPIQSWGSNSDVHVTGQPPAPPNEVTLAEMRFVTPGYFDAMGIRLMRGRMLSESIDLSSDKAATVVVNQAFVKKFMPTVGDPAGQHLDDNDKPDEKTALVGEVSNIRQSLFDPPLAEMDYLITEIPAKNLPSYAMAMNLIVRTKGDPDAVIPELRQVFHEIDPTLPFRTPLTMEEVIANQLVMQRLESWLFGIFAALAVLLAVIGLYGLISHEVEMGTRDIGVRMALGATRGGVASLVLRRVTILLAVGIGVGLVLTFAAQKLIASVAVIEFAHQAGLLALLAATLAVAGLLAAAIPVRRAASIEPMRALRME